MDRDKIRALLEQATPEERRVLKLKYHAILYGMSGQRLRRITMKEFILIDCPRCLLVDCKLYIFADRSHGSHEIITWNGNCPSCRCQITVTTRTEE